MNGCRLRYSALLASLLLLSCRPERDVSQGQKSETIAVSDDLGPEPYCIALTGTNHRWVAQYPKTSGLVLPPQELGPGHDLHVPADTKVALVLKSTDYLYTMAIPKCGLKEIAVPGLEFRMVHRWDQPGTYALEGEELCGTPGQNGPGRLVVERRDHFAARLQRNSVSE